MSFGQKSARVSALPILGAALAAVLGAVAACSNTNTAAGITPPTGILVRSENLVAGKGCGTGPAQVFKFAAVVQNDDGAMLAGATYDCFADGSFQNLPPSSNGSFHYKLHIFAYDKPTYTASAPAIEAGAGDANRLAALPSTWTTTCDATEQADVEVSALCAPLTPTPATGPGSVRVPTDTFAAAGDAGTLACGTNFTTVQGVTSDDAGATSSVECPAPLLFGGFTAETPFTTTVRLLFAGAPVGTTTCRATARPGTEVVATCDPVAK